MALFLTIFEGSSPRTAQPLVATQDQKLIATIVRELVGRLSPPQGGRVVPLAAPGAERPDQ